MSNHLEQEIVNEYTRIKEILYSTYPEAKSSDQSTYKSILKESKFKMFFKILMGLLNSNVSEKEYLVLGLREKSFLTSLPRKKTALIAKNLSEVLFAIKERYSFYYLGLAEYKMIEAYFERDPSKLVGILVKILRLVDKLKKPAFIFYFTDVAPMEIIFRIISNQNEGLFTICLQHGVLLEVNQEFILEGSLSDYFLSNGEEQRRIASRLLGEKTKIFDMGPAYEFPIIEDEGPLDVILVTNGGADVDLKRSSLTNRVLNQLSKRLEVHSIKFSIKLHPSDQSISFEAKENLYNGTKYDVLSNKPKVFIGFVSTLLYEAHLIGHTSVEIRLRNEKLELNCEQLNTFTPDYSFFDDELDLLCNKLKELDCIKKKEVESFKALPLKERIYDSITRIEEGIK